MAKTSVSSKNQSGGITANRINSHDVDTKLVLRYRAEGFIAGIILSIFTGVIGNLVYDWLFR